ncbi:helix-turn-helix protein [Agrobacterium vitis]|nr:helix-turn-helix protein [Agrobacterium vitis]
MDQVLPEKAALPRDSLGCSRDKLKIDQSISNGRMNFYRKGALSAPKERVITPANNRGYLLGLSASNGHRRRIFHEHHSSLHDFEENSVYLRSFAQDYQADLQGTFDFLLLEVSEAAMAIMADEADIKGVVALECVSERPDPVLGGLLAALFSPVGGEINKSALFVDQISVAIGIHLAQHYGNRPSQSLGRRRMLSTRLLAALQSQVRSNLDGQLSVEELARTCNLSTSAFLQAFRETTGKTPHQWLTLERIEKAKDVMLSSTQSLRDIAILCGFADQSHFTRVFLKMTGATPASWRRIRQF